MPTAIQNCTGSMRLVPVKRFRDDDKAECCSCTLRLKSERRTERGGQDLYYVLPPHQPVGIRDGSKVDWSNV